MPSQADRETAAQRLGLDVPPDSERQRIEDAATVARFLAETALGGAGYTAKPHDVIPVAARIYTADMQLSDAAASVRIEYEARDVCAERIQAEQAVERERQKREKAEQAAREAKAAILDN